MPTFRGFVIRFNNYNFTIKALNNKMSNMHQGYSNDNVTDAIQYL